MLKRMIAVGLVCIATPLAAAEKGKLGFVGEPWGPTQFGLIWHVGEKYALRPAAGGFLGANRFRYRDEACVVDGYCQPDRDTDWGDVAGGVDLLRYFGSRDGFSPYLALGVDLRTASAESDDREATSQREISPRFVVGLQHSFGSRVAIYGELGVETAWYRRRQPPRTTTEWTADTLASAAGVVLYLN